MVEYEVTKTTLGHVLELSENVSDEDAQEAWAAGHVIPIEALLLGMEASRDTRTFLADGEVMCIYGVGQIELVDVGVPWMLSSRSLSKHYRYFARASAACMAEQQKTWTQLVNYVDARNARAIRWLSWLGFEIEEPRGYGPDDLPFHRFSWRSSCPFL